MNEKESEEMRNIFVDDKIQRRILELLDTGMTDEEIVDKVLGELDQ
jgi:hypothetical protein